MEKPVFSSFRNQALERNDLASKLPLNAPYALFVEFTNKCNFRCTFCPESLTDYESRANGFHFMDQAFFDSLCEQINVLGRLRVLRFYMLGEPLLNKQTLSFIAQATNMGIAERTELTSNGSAITESVAEELVKSGLDYLQISIYAMDPDRHRRITGSVISPDRIRRGVEAVKNARQSNGGIGPFIVTKMIDPFDPGEEAAFRDTYKNIADEVIINSPMNWNDDPEKDFIKDSYATDIDRKSLFTMKKEVCTFPFYTLVVHSDGAVSVCCADWEKQAVVGDLKKQTLSEIWSGSKLREFQTMHIERRRNENPACKGCTFLYTVPDNIDCITSPLDLWPSNL